MASVPQAVLDWCQEQGYGRVVASQPVGGGCINNGARISCETGQSFFLKTNRRTPPDMFACEAEGLQALNIEGAPRVPQVHLYAGNFILMEDLAPAARRADYWPAFGYQLAHLHRQSGARFGFEHDNYIGSTPQPNAWRQDGYAFFGEQRLLFQARLAQQRGLLGSREVDWVQALVRRLPELVPGQPPALIHGDLWSGNAISGPQGEPALIDPATHYGWAESELAMTSLFGSFPEAFYQAYQEVNPLEPNFRRRYPIYNLYHLLNHLNLFGAGYLGEVVSILKYYNR